MPDTLTRDQAEAHITHWRNEVLDAHSDARRQLAQRCLDNWLDQYADLPRQRTCD